MFVHLDEVVPELIFMRRNRHAGAVLSAREAALTFMSGISDGWNLWAFQEWYNRYMLAPGRIRPMTRASHIVFREPGIGVVELVDNLAHLPLRARLDTMNRCYLALVTAHTRVLTVLRRHVASHSIEFVHAALYTHRLMRVSDGPDQDAAWLVSVEPADALSDCILALFAADYLIHTGDYLRALGVCRICDRIGFREGQRSRTLCETHGEGLTSLNRTVAITACDRIDGQLPIGSN